MAVVDFTPEERAFLCGPHAEAALASAGVHIEDLRPRAVESFEEPQEMRAKAHEKRRVYQWRLVRQMLQKIEHKQATAQRSKAAAEEAALRAPPPKAHAVAPVGGAEGVGAAAQRAHELALRQMVQRETRALERELRAEKQRERLEDQQRAADDARRQILADREQERAASRESREFLADVRAARRDLEGQALARQARPASAPPARPHDPSGDAGMPGSARGRPVSSASQKDGIALSAVVRERAETARLQREKDIQDKMASKAAATARRREEVENERAMKRLYAEQSRLRHEERLAGVHLAALEQTVRQQRELEEKQAKAQRERAAMRAAVGKVTINPGEDRGETARQEGGFASAEAREERASKVEQRAAQAQDRLAERQQKIEREAELRDAKADAYRQASERQRDEERRRQHLRNHELEMKRAAKRAAKQVADEVHRARVESATELATRRAAEQKAKLAYEREQKRLAQEVREEAHRQNAERVQRATDHRRALVEASIQNKTLRYEQRKQTAEETQYLRQAYQAARYKQQASMVATFGSSSAKQLQSDAKQAATFTSGAAGMEPDAAGVQPVAESHESVTRAFRADRKTRSAGDAGPGGVQHQSNRVPTTIPPPASTGPAAPMSSAEREDARQRAAFAGIERLRAQQNAELRAAVEAEQKAEAERVDMLSKVADGPDRVRLQKLLKLERDRADAELRGLTAEHELALAERFKRLGVTR